MDVLKTRFMAQVRQFALVLLFVCRALVQVLVLRLSDVTLGRFSRVLRL